MSLVNLNEETLLSLRRMRWMRSLASSRSNIS